MSRLLFSDNDKTSIGIIEAISTKNVKLNVYF